MKYLYFGGAAMCGILAVCSILSLTGAVDLGLELKDAIIGVLGLGIGLGMGIMVHRDENKDGPTYLR